MRCVRIYFVPAGSARIPDDIYVDLERNKIMWPDKGLPYIVSNDLNAALHFKEDQAIYYGFAKNIDEARERNFYLTGELCTDEEILEFCKHYMREKSLDSVEQTLDFLK